MAVPFRLCQGVWIRRSAVCLVVFWPSAPGAVGQECVPPDPSNTCYCINPSFPCWSWSPVRNACTCRGISSQASCEGSGGSFCVVPDACVDGCDQCRTAAECRTCASGYALMSGQCTSIESVAADASIHVKSNLVLLGSSSVFTALSDAYQGSVDRFEVINLALRTFLHMYRDNFDYILVIPHTELEGSESHGQNWGVTGDDSGGRLRSVLTLQMYGPGTSSIPLLHEMAHRWGVFLSDIVPGGMSHWGMTAFDKQGMLGGFDRAGIRCAQDSQPVTRANPCPSNRLTWDFSMGSPMTSHDGIGEYSKFELLLMGTHSVSDLAGDELVYCEGANPSYGSGETTVTCSNIGVYDASEVEATISDSTRSKQIARGTELRVATVVVFPSSAAPDSEAASATFVAGSELAWLDGYLGDSVARFSAATYSRASLSFAVISADLRSSSEVVGSPPPPAPFPSPSPPTQSSPSPPSSPSPSPSPLPPPSPLPSPPGAGAAPMTGTTTTNAPKNQKVQVAMDLEVDAPSDFVADPKSTIAVEKSLATVSGKNQSSCSCTLSVKSRRLSLARRLSGTVGVIGLIDTNDAADAAAVEGVLATVAPDTIAAETVSELAILGVTSTVSVSNMSIGVVEEDVDVEGPGADGNSPNGTNAPSGTIAPRTAMVASSAGCVKSPRIVFFVFFTFMIAIFPVA